MERLHLELLVVPGLGLELTRGLTATLPAKHTAPPAHQHRPGGGSSVGQGGLWGGTGPAGASGQLGSAGMEAVGDGSLESEGVGHPTQQLSAALQHSMEACAADVVLLACVDSAVTATPASAVAHAAVGQTGRAPVLAALQALAASCRYAFVVLQVQLFLPVMR